MGRSLARSHRRKAWRQRLVTTLGSLALVAFIALSSYTWESVYPSLVTDGLSYHAIEIG